MTDTEKNAPVSILGIGRAGLRIISALAAMELPKQFKLMAVDTDRSDLESCGIPAENRLFTTAGWRNGMGCGGNMEFGLRAIAHVRQQIGAMLAGSRLLIVVGGLGGGTAGGGVRIIRSIANQQEIAVMFVLTLPFSLEGHSKDWKARGALEGLSAEADVVLALPNDLLFTTLPSKTPLLEAFRLMDGEVARIVLALGTILCGEALLPANFCDFMSVLRLRKSLCCIGSGRASGSEEAAAGGSRCRLALDRMLESPLLGGAEKIETADAVVISLLGDAGLNIGEARQALDEAGKFVPEGARLIVNAATSPMLHDEVLLTVVAIKYEMAEDPDAVLAMTGQKTITGARRDGQEVEEVDLPFMQAVNKGIMENTIAVIIDNEDMDVPTFMRRDMKIDTGSMR